jgi:hypothetical protein
MGTQHRLLHQVPAHAPSGEAPRQTWQSREHLSRYLNAELLREQIKPMKNITTT